MVNKRANRKEREKKKYIYIYIIITLCYVPKIGGNERRRKERQLIMKAYCMYTVKVPRIYIHTHTHIYIYTFIWVAFRVYIDAHTHIYTRI